MNKNYKIYLDKILSPLQSALKKYEGELYLHNNKLKEYTKRMTDLVEKLNQPIEEETLELTPEERDEIQKKIDGFQKKIKNESVTITHLTKSKDHIAQKIERYRNDDYKTEIETQIKEDLDKIKQKVIDKKERILKKKEDKKIKKKERVERQKKWKNESRQRYLQYREMDRSYRHFIKASKQFPDYLQKKLEKMPENKGYIWKGIWFFGLKPCKTEYPLRMFERTHDKMLLIHEHTKTHYRVYEKDPKHYRRQKLIFERKKKSKQGYEFSLNQFVKN